MRSKQMRQSILLASAMALSACVQPGLQTGGSGNLVTGSAGGASSVNANKTLERCAAPLGTLAVSDGRISGTRSVTNVNPLIRLAVQQSNCFVLTSAANLEDQALLDAMDMGDRSGEVRAGSNRHKGQRVATDYLMKPEVIVNNEATHGTGTNIGAGLMGIGLGAAGLGGLGAAVGGFSRSVETRTTDVALTLIDVRSRVQVGIAQGSSTATNVDMGGGIGMGGWGGVLAGAVGVGLGTFTRTPEGQATAAAFFDAYNQLVISLRNYEAQDVKGGMGRGGHLKVN